MDAARVERLARERRARKWQGWYCERVWKNSGDVNFLPLWSAALNLERNGLVAVVAEQAATLLAAGEVLETELAYFRPCRRGRRRLCVQP